MKRFFIISALALAAGVFVSCQKEAKEEQVSVETATIYLTSGLPGEEVNYAITYNELTDKYETVGSNVVTLKLAAQKEVQTAVQATLKADMSKLPASWTAMPEGAFKFDRATAEIAAGAKEGKTTFQITLDADKMSEAGQYALPLAIETSSENAMVSSTATTVIVKFTRTIEKGVPENWGKITSDNYTVNTYADYAGFDYTSYDMGLASAFDNDLTTGWYAEAMYWYEDAEDETNSGWVYAQDYSSYYGCFAEVVFKEPVDLRGLVVSADPDNDYYWCRPRRLTIMFKYEGDDDYTWNKMYSDGYIYDDDWNIIGEDEENEDEKYFTFCPALDENIGSIPGYKPSSDDYLITDANYEAFVLDLSEKLAGKKITAMIIAPARLYVGQADYNSELSDYNYEYGYDLFTGVFTNEITLFE